MTDEIKTAMRSLMAAERKTLTELVAAGLITPDEVRTFYGLPRVGRTGDILK